MVSKLLKHFILSSISPCLGTADNQFVFKAGHSSDGVSRLGLGLDMCLETRFLESRSRRSRLGLGLEVFRSRSPALRLKTLHRLFFMRFCKEFH